MVLLILPPPPNMSFLRIYLSSAPLSFLHNLFLYYFFFPLYVLLFAQSLTVSTCFLAINHVMNQMEKSLWATGRIFLEYGFLGGVLVSLLSLMANSRVMFLIHRSASLSFSHLSTTTLASVHSAESVDSKSHLPGYPLVLSPLLTPLTWA